MQVENFQLKWTHSFCRGHPSFLSEKILMIPFDFAIKTCDLKGKNLHSSDKPCIRIGCATTMPELGVIALSERKEKCDIFILNYPEMNTISKLQRGNNEEYRILQFTGCEFLISLSIKKEHEIDLWKWSTGQRLCCISDTLTSAESFEVNLSVNPLMWSELCLQSNTKICLLSIKSTDDKYHFKMKNIFLEQEDDGTFKVLLENSSDSLSGKDGNNFKLNLVCHCWLPKDCILIETSSGLLKVNPYLHHATTFPREPESKSVITSMVLNKLGLFVSYKTGFVDIVNISRGHWSIIETIKVGHPIINLQLSPLYDILAITTSKGSVSLYDTNTLDLHEVLRSDCAGEIGICIIEPLSQYCLVAKKTGCLHIFRIANGSLMSAIQIDEDITSIASSPLCSLVLIGSNSGFLHFLDVTYPKHPKVVHCVRPYEAPIEHVKFENFGTLFATYAPDHHVNIWNGLPSSDFNFLGSIKILEQVKDIAMFKKKEEESTTLLILSESGSSSEKEAGNILIRLILPEDFATDPKKYHIDVFKNLSYDELYFQKWRLNYPCSRMDMHINMGVVFYSPIIGKIQRFSIWNTSDSKMTNLLKSKDVTTICVSTNQRWIGIIDVHGYLQLYSSEQMKLFAGTPKSVSNDIICRHFLDINILGNRLITGSESGYILCYKWGYDLPESKIIPEWIVYCHSRSEKENSYLRNMDEEESADLKMCGIFPKSVISLPYEELQQKLQMHVAIVNYKLYELLESKDSETEPNFKVNEIVLDDQSLYKLSDHNYRNFLLLIQESNTEHIMNEQNIKNCSLSEMKEITSTSLGYVVHNYSAVQFLSGDYVMKNSLSESKAKDKTNEYETDLNIFGRGMKFKTETERFALIEDMIKIIRDWKVEFNIIFDDVYEENKNVSNRISEIVQEMKYESSKLPSAAERDFWKAFLLSGEPEHHGGILETQSMKSEYRTELSDSNQNIDNQPEYKDTQIRHSKSSIENMTISAKELRLELDLKVERLFFKRFYCDYIIHFLEMKIFCILLFTLTEREFFTCQNETEKQLESLVDFIRKFDLLLKESREIEKNLRYLYSRVQRQERNLDYKVEAKCNKNGDKEQAYFGFRQLPNFPLRKGSENPFWTSGLTLNQEDLLLDEQNSEFACPKGVDVILWKSICSKRSQYIKLGVILRHTQNQIMGITNLILDCSEITSKLEIKQRYCKRIIENMKFLLKKLNEKMYALLTENLDNPRMFLENDLNEQKECVRFPDLNRVPPVRNESWETVRINIKANQNLQKKLEEVQDSIKTFLCIQREISSKLEKSKVKYELLHEKLQKELEKQKKALSESKTIIDDSVDDKWNIRKMLS
ncbi:Cilia- and flagella-associated protein 43 like protein [Argiope bruennichi]|uniref:Cilia- and flagella-associated protein 43 n=1 Tax=Argiope bruennichi TaxID=94029 RepID=A0A8T0E421_ARGBR|nr:Cilia- and flagella-associated protein 43 like protein [Argiope bruennichi]